MWEMKFSTCLIPIENNFVQITELDDGKQYLPEDSALTARNRFKFTDTASIDIFRLNSTGGSHNTPAVITMRDNLKPSEIKLDSDGWFTAIHIVIPTQNWVYNELSKKNSIIYVYDVVYFTDGKDIYTCTKGKIERTTLQHLLDEVSENTTISRTDTDYVSITLLQTQLAESYKSLFETRMYNGGCKLNACEANRLLAAVNLTRHYVRMGQLAEAERIIEKVNYFNNPIPNRHFRKDTKTYNDCGCS